MSTPDTSAPAPGPWGELLAAGRVVLRGLDGYVPDFCDPCTQDEREDFRAALSACEKAGSLDDSLELAAACALHARERNRLRTGIEAARQQAEWAGLRAAAMDPGGAWAREFAALETALAGLLEGAGEGEPKP